MFLEGINRVKFNLWLLKITSAFYPLQVWFIVDKCFEPLLSKPIELLAKM